MKLMKRFHLAAMAAAMLAPAAMAADLGGNCCADLEERVAELEATAARKGTRKMSLTVYGQVNYGVMWLDAPGVSQKTITNNPLDPTRFGIKGEAKFGSGLSAGYLLEIGTDQASFSGKTDDVLNIRHSAMYLKSDSLGAVWLGKTSTATDGISEISLANVKPASKMLNIDPLAGTYLAGSNLPFDGTRENVLRYDSPVLQGLSVSAAWIADKGDDAWDVALRYNVDLGDFSLAAGAGYRTEPSVFFSEKVKTLTGSASIKHQVTGLFLSGAYGKIDGTTFNGFLPFQDSKAWHVQAGIERKPFDIGKTTLYGEFAELKQFNSTIQMYGAGLVQSIECANMDLYVGYRNYDDVKIQTLMTGAVIRF